jgi:hypothetical protein
MQLPFTILVDSAEGQPYTFDFIRCDSPNGDQVWEVTTQYACLGRHPHGLGDYSIDGMKGRVHVERKSPQDCVSTVLGFSGRRERFERELENLAKIEASIVMVECSIEDLFAISSQHTHQPTQVVAKQVNSSILAMMQDYRVPWFFAVSRRHAEISTFRFLKRFWKHKA